MVDFSTLKKSRGKGIAKLNEEIENLSKKSFSNQDEDERFWKLTVDKAGNGHAVIRFLPPAAGEDLPWVRMFNHGFQGPGGAWYIENSLTTIDKKDPVSEFNTKLWNSGNEEDKATARVQKRKLSYYSNILVISDPSNPDNDGKVFLFRYGQKIFDKVNDLMNPEFPDDDAINPFDLWDGASFRLRAKKVQGYRNYDTSVFNASTPVADDDGAIEEIWKQEYTLQDIIAPDKFKTYEELQSRLNIVLGSDPGGSRSPSEDPAPQRVREESPLPTAEAALADEVASEDSEEGLDFFRKLANED